MGISVIHHEHHFLYMWILSFEQFLHKMGKIETRVLVACLHKTMASQWFTGQKHTACAFAFVFIILPIWLPRLHPYRFMKPGHQLFGGLVQTDLRKSCIIGTLIHLSHVFHRCYAFPIPRPWYDPFFVLPRFEFVFFRVRRIVSRLTFSPVSRITKRSASKRTLQLA